MKKIIVSILISFQVFAIDSYGMAPTSALLLETEPSQNLILILQDKEDFFRAIDDWQNSLFALEGETDFKVREALLGGLSEEDWRVTHIENFIHFIAMSSQSSGIKQTALGYFLTRFGQFPEIHRLFLERLRPHLQYYACLSYSNALHVLDIIKKYNDIFNSSNFGDEIKAISNFKNDYEREVKETGHSHNLVDLLNYATEQEQNIEIVDMGRAGSRGHVTVGDVGLTAHFPHSGSRQTQKQFIKGLVKEAKRVLDRRQPIAKKTLGDSSKESKRLQEQKKEDDISFADNTAMHRTLFKNNNLYKKSFKDYIKGKTTSDQLAETFLLKVWPTRKDDLEAEAAEKKRRDENYAIFQEYRQEQKKRHSQELEQKHQRERWKEEFDELSKSLHQQLSQNNLNLDDLKISSDELTRLTELVKNPFGSLKTPLSERLYQLLWKIMPSADNQQVILQLMEMLRVLACGQLKQTPLVASLQQESLQYVKRLYLLWLKLLSQNDQIQTRDNIDFIYDLTMQGAVDIVDQPWSFPPSFWKDKLPQPFYRRLDRFSIARLRQEGAFYFYKIHGQTYRSHESEKLHLFLARLMKQLEQPYLAFYRVSDLKYFMFSPYTPTVEEMPSAEDIHAVEDLPLYHDEDETRLYLKSYVNQQEFLSTLR